MSARYKRINAPLKQMGAWLLMKKWFGMIGRLGERMANEDREEQSDGGPDEGGEESQAASRRLITPEMIAAVDLAAILAPVTDDDDYAVEKQLQTAEREAREGGNADQSDVLELLAAIMFIAVRPDDEANPFAAKLIMNGRRSMTTPEAFAAFRGASTFPRSLLHPAIDREAWPSFNRGRFDSAIFEAFREVEIAVREAAGFPQHEHGVAMVRRAFHKEHGPLTDMSVDDAEREATSNLFAGSVGSYKNPGSHRRVGREDVAEAGELLMLASHLLRIVDVRARSESC